MVAVILAAVGIIAWSTIPAWPVIGVGVAVVAVCLNSIGSRLKESVCWSCGASLKDEPVGTHGSLCRSCGAFNQPLLTRAEQRRSGHESKDVSKV